MADNDFDDVDGREEEPDEGALRAENEPLPLVLVSPEFPGYRVTEKPGSKKCLARLIAAVRNLEPTDLAVQKEAAALLVTAAEDAMAKLRADGRHLSPLGSVRVTVAGTTLFVRIRALFEVERVYGRECRPLPDSPDIVLKPEARALIKRIAPGDMKVLTHLLRLRAAEAVSLGEPHFRFKWSVPRIGSEGERMPIDFLADTSGWFSYRDGSSLPVFPHPADEGELPEDDTNCAKEDEVVEAEKGFETVKSELVRIELGRMRDAALEASKLSRASNECLRRCREAAERAGRLTGKPAAEFLQPFGESAEECLKKEELRPQIRAPKAKPCRCGFFSEMAGKKRLIALTAVILFAAAAALAVW